MRATTDLNRRGFSGQALVAGLALIVATLGTAAPAAAQEERGGVERRDGQGRREADEQLDVGDQLEADVPEEPEPEDRLRFEVQIDEESGGGTAVVLAEELDLEGEIYVLIGRVEVQYQDIEIRADRAELDAATGSVTALGNVVLDQGPSRLTGATISFDLEEKTGALTQARGYVSSDYYFRGEEVHKTGDVSYSVLRGAFSSCSQDVPGWSFTTKRTNFVIDGYARTRGAAMRVKNVPVFYWPYMIWPVKPERSSGLLVPKPGYSARQGTTLGLAYFQTLGNSVDTTFHFDYSSEDYNSFGNQFRYQPTEGTSGLLEAVFIEDPTLDSTRWRVTYQHDSKDLPAGFRGIVRVDEASDFDYFRDFEREVRNNSRRQLYSFGYLSRNWGRQSMNLIVDRRETLISGDSVVELSQLPELEYQVRATQLGNTPLYLGLKSAFHYLSSSRSDRFDESYERLNLSPVLTLPFRAFPWLSFSVDAGADFTYWGNSLYRADELDPDNPPPSVYRDETLDRLVPTLRAEIVGPSISRVFNGGQKKWSKFKHIVEPRFAYAFIETFDEADRIPRFDELDVIRGANVARMSFINRLLAKPVDEGSGGGREIMSLELFQLRSFDDDRPLQRSQDGTKTSQGGPLTLLYRYQPSRNTTLRQEVRYSTLFSGLESAATSGSFAFGRHSAGLRWTTRLNPELDRTTKNQFRVSTDFSLIRDKLRYITGLSYDANTGFLSQQRHIFNYTGSCWGFVFEYSEWARNQLAEKDRVFRFSVNLKNVGTFLDFAGGENESL
jgi:LPS-assembly protein